ncbi:T9SS type A sorting domain-containing protein [Gaetbulibacter jejuensis]|uniref:T9SS type A sorting domain-containing protein n=1 Tax=Gaetbulibacter jejuensis TaxID=584607 RepID=UPI00300846C5
MRLLIFNLFLFFSFNAFSQLHHQMLSVQGQTISTANGLKVTQTVGQQSVIGNKTIFNNSFIVGQGYQQAVRKALVQSSDNTFAIGIYPNPFEDNIHLSVQGNLTGNCHFQIFDILGRLVRDFTIVEDVINQPIDLSDLESATYLVKVSNKNKSYFTKLIKQ